MVAKESTTHSISDLRRRTRLGMGTCQGTFCTYRAVGTVQEVTDTWTGNTKDLFKEFLEARWKGIRPVMWGNQIKDVELTRGIYEVSLNINHESDTTRQFAAAAAGSAATGSAASAAAEAQTAAGAAKAASTATAAGAGAAEADKTKDLKIKVHRKASKSSQEAK